MQTTLPPIIANGAIVAPPTLISGLGPWGPTHMLAVVPSAAQYSVPADAYVVFHEPNGSPISSAAHGEVVSIDATDHPVVQAANEQLLNRSGDYYLSDHAGHGSSMEIHIALRCTDRIVAQANAFKAALRTMFNVSASQGFMRVVLPDVEDDGFGGLPLKPYVRMLAESAMESWGKKPEAAPNQIVLAHERAVPSSVGVFKSVFDEELGRTNGHGFDVPPTRTERFGSWMWRNMSPTGGRAKEMESMLGGGVVEPVVMAAMMENVVADPDSFDRGVVGALSALAMSGTGQASFSAIDILKALHIENRDVGPYAGWLLARIGLQTNLALARGRGIIPE